MTQGLAGGRVEEGTRTLTTECNARRLELAALLLPREDAWPLLLRLAREWPESTETVSDCRAPGVWCTGDCATGIRLASRCNSGAAASSGSDFSSSLSPAPSARPLARRAASEPTTLGTRD